MVLENFVLNNGEVLIIFQDLIPGFSFIFSFISSYLLNSITNKFSFNRIDLPCYESYEKLQQKLMFAMEQSGAFGID